MKSKLIFLFIIVVIYPSKIRGQDIDSSTYWVRRFVQSFEYQRALSQVKDSLRHALMKDPFIPRRYKNMNVDELKYFVIWKAKFRNDAMNYTFQDNIYKYLEWDYKGLGDYAYVFKRNNKFVGRLFIFGLLSFEPFSEYNRYARKLLKQYYKRLRDLGGETYFIVNGFGKLGVGLYLWFIKNDKIYIYRRGFDDVHEVNDFIVKFLNEETIRSIATLKE